MRRPVGATQLEETKITAKPGPTGFHSARLVTSGRWSGFKNHSRPTRSGVGSAAAPRASKTTSASFIRRRGLRRLDCGGDASYRRRWVALAAVARLVCAAPRRVLRCFAYALPLRLRADRERAPRDRSGCGARPTHDSDQLGDPRNDACLCRVPYVSHDAVRCIAGGSATSASGTG